MNKTHQELIEATIDSEFEFSDNVDKLIEQLMNIYDALTFNENDAYPILTKAFNDPAIINRITEMGEITIFEIKQYILDFTIAQIQLIKFNEDLKFVQDNMIENLNELKEDLPHTPGDLQPLIMHKIQTQNDVTIAAEREALIAEFGLVGQGDFDLPINPPFLAPLAVAPVNAVALDLENRQILEEVQAFQAAEAIEEVQIFEVAQLIEDVPVNAVNMPAGLSAMQIEALELGFSLQDVLNGVSYTEISEFKQLIELDMDPVEAMGSVLNNNIPE